MSGADSDLDFWASINGDEPRATASCQDCGIDIVPSAPPLLCDPCADTRARWADALEARQQARVNLALPRRRSA